MPGGQRFEWVQSGTAAFLRWREACHRKPALTRAYRVGVALVGGLVVALGVILIPLPGPGWLIVFVGLSILASEFPWAERLLRYARVRVAAWTRWVVSRSRPQRLALGASGVAILALLVLLIATWQGLVPVLVSSRTSAL